MFDLNKWLPPPPWKGPPIPKFATEQHEPERVITPPRVAGPAKNEVATACVACAVNHFSTTSGLLNEATRFKAEGIQSNEVLDRISKCLQELNALERVDLSPEKIRAAPAWERPLAEEALVSSRALRHRIESVKTVEELQDIAADMDGCYRMLHKKWWRTKLAENK